jgi:hypothetical protein
MPRTIDISAILTLALAALPLAPVPGQPPAAPPRQSTDLFIREKAGLPAASARGETQILDIGHNPLDTMISIAANRAGDGWHVSYACADSPHCAPGSDHFAREYTLSVEASAEVDRILAGLETGAEPDGMKPSPNFLGGQLLVSIRYRGFTRDYRRVGQWGRTLGRLEQLLAEPAREPAAARAETLPTSTAHPRDLSPPP